MSTSPADRDDRSDELSASPDADALKTSQPMIATDPMDTGSLGVVKPTVSLDPEAVKKAEAEGKGYV